VSTMLVVVEAELALRLAVWIYSADRKEELGRLDHRLLKVVAG